MQDEIKEEIMDFIAAKQRISGNFNSVNHTTLSIVEAKRNSFIFNNLKVFFLR